MELLKKTVHGTCRFAKIEQLRLTRIIIPELRTRRLRCHVQSCLATSVVKNKNIKGRPFKVSSDVYKVNDSCNYGDHVRLRLKNVEIYNIFQAELFKILVDHIDFGIVASLLYTNCNKTLNAKSILGFSICDHDFSDEIPTLTCTSGSLVTSNFTMTRCAIRTRLNRIAQRQLPEQLDSIRVATHAATQLRDSRSYPVATSRS